MIYHNPPGPGTYRTGSETRRDGPRRVSSSLCVLVTRWLPLECQSVTTPNATCGLGPGQRPSRHRRAFVANALSSTRIFDLAWLGGIRHDVTVSVRITHPLVHRTALYPLTLSNGCCYECLGSLHGLPACFRRLTPIWTPPWSVRPGYNVSYAHILPDISRLP